MNYKKCECGCDILVQFSPQITNVNDFRVWKPGEKVKADVHSVPVFLCVKCGALDIPYASMQGKNRLDPDVKAYEKLFEYVKEYNEKNKKIASVIKALEVKISNLESLVSSKCNCTETKAEEKVKEVSQEKVASDAKQQPSSKQQPGKGNKKGAQPSSK